MNLLVFIFCYQERLLSKPRISNHEQIEEFSAPCEIIVGPNVAHLLTADTDCIFLESFDREYSAIDYMPYRHIIKKQLETNLE